MYKLFEPKPLDFLEMVVYPHRKGKVEAVQTFYEQRGRFLTIFADVF